MQSENGVCIRVNNSYSRYENMNFQTQKSNAKEHGYGMKIVDDVVKKYKGTWEIQVDDTEYVVRQTICI
ncbi:GHKL domain-containing protein [Hespellia stercorisuis DSM 15480]|uniref:GHKL domain-containing protein n=2 Tax=Hespellia stercorisuis TaxID=180311 RepID=A0A1M6UNL9_9FIRM|nr:GHKL domain-containing protein [Hespellia stercorisuis DSM 15480]